MSTDVLSLLLLPVHARNDTANSSDQLTRQAKGSAHHACGIVTTTTTYSLAFTFNFTDMQIVRRASVPNETLFIHQRLLSKHIGQLSPGQC